MGGQIRTDGIALSLGIPGTRIGVGIGFGDIFGGQRREQYFYISGQRSLGISPIDISWERVTLRPGLNSSALEGKGITISASAGVLRGLVYDQDGNVIGNLEGLRSNVDLGFSTSNTWLISVPIEAPNQHTTVEFFDYGATDYRTRTTTYFYQPNQGTVRASVVDRYYHTQDTEFGPTTSLVGEQAVENSVWNARAPNVPPRCFLPGTPILMADGTEKPIESVRVGDLVMSFDPAADGGRGALVPSRVKRTFQNTTRTVVDLRGLRMTPGHVCLTDGGRFETIAAILARDGALVDKDGHLVRARTGARLGSPDDALVRVLYVDPAGGETRTVTVRAGIPCGLVATADGGKAPLTLAAALAEAGLAPLPDGTLRRADGEVFDSSDWPAGTTPLDSPEGRNWVVAGPDGQPYTPDWIRGLEAEAAEEAAVGATARTVTAGPGAARPGPGAIGGALAGMALIGTLVGRPRH